ncbi:MAG: BsuPI-related putative proteinase inhibitor [Acidimicrobiales bacterium]
MTLRALTLLAAMALAACGAGQDPALQGDAATSSTTSPEGGGDLSLAVDVPDPLVSGQQVTWRLTVTNGSGTDVTLTFTSGQQGDVVLRGGDGAEAYRWSDGMMFSQALADVVVPAGGEVTFELAGELGVAPGDYDLEASVPSAPAPEPVTRQVTVTG